MTSLALHDLQRVGLQGVAHYYLNTASGKFLPYRMTDVVLVVGFA